jgi:lipoic acid synthetase
MDAATDISSTTDSNQRRSADPAPPGGAGGPSPDALARTLARHPRPLGGDTSRAVGASLVNLSGYILNNQADAAQHLRIGKKPDWLRAKVPGGDGYARLKSIIDEHRLHTVCQEASCPNMGECWSRGTATIMILGDVCTRSCGFCNVKTGKPPVLDTDEPRRVAESLRLMQLRHVVITSVNRDELADGGAAIWAETIERVHEACPWMSVEVLVGDFCGDERAIQKVIDAKPEILAHNMETVKRMHPAVRPQAKYERSLAVLRQIKDNGLVTKTGIMVGIGERDDEVDQLMDDVMRESRADILTIGQYLQPTRNHLPIDRWVSPAQFDGYRVAGLAKGFRVVESGPLVRSSYHAEEQADRLNPDQAEVHRRMEALIALGKERSGRVDHLTS